MFDCAIIGAGPAGVTAAIYLRRNYFKVAIIEKNCVGGQIINSPMIANYPGILPTDGASIAYTMSQQLENYSPHFISSEVIDIKKDDHFTVICKDEEVEAQTVLVCSGMHHKILGIKDEQKYLNKGISWCATCDGTLYKGKDVAVVGGGMSALETCIYLSRIVNKIYLIHRRDSFRCDEFLVNKFMSLNKVLKKTEICFNEEIVGMNGKDHLEQLVLKSGRTLNVDGLFECIGFEPNTNFLANLSLINQSGFIIVDKEGNSKVDGLYAAGDVISKDVRQITTAVGDATIAAT